MNLFNQLNHRYGQSCIKEVRSWEGKEQKLTRHKCHLHFNLRCLSQNIVPKGVKLNIKQFSMFQERKIICRTHRSILNSCVRYCNRIIKKLQSHIDKIKTSIKNKFNNKDFKDIVKLYTNPGKKCSKLLKTAKSRSSTTYNNSPDTGTCLFQTSLERNGSSTCPASHSAMESNLFYRKGQNLL